MISSSGLSAECNFRFDWLKFDRKPLEIAFPSKSSRVLPDQLLDFLENSTKNLSRIKWIRFFFAKLICLSIAVATISAVLLYLMENHLDKTAAYISSVFAIFFLSALGIFVAIILKCFFEPRTMIAFVQELCFLVEIYNEDSSDLIAHVKFDNEMEDLAVELVILDKEERKKRRPKPQRAPGHPELDPEEVSLAKKQEHFSHEPKNDLDELEPDL